MSPASDWDEYEEDHNGSDTSTDETGKRDNTVDYTNLKLDVERIRYQWDEENSKYNIVPDDGTTEKENEPVVEATVPTHAFVLARRWGSKELRIWSPYCYKVVRKLMEPYTRIGWSSNPLTVRLYSSFVIFQR